MKLQFYFYGGNAKKMTKTFSATQPNEFNAKLKEGCSLFNPTFVVNTSRVFSGTDKNYVIATWPDSRTRNYFVKDIIANTDGTCSVVCEEDVLTTVKDQLGNLKVIIERIEGDGTPYLQDSMMPVDVRPHTRIVEFKGTNVGFDTNLSYILHCAGPAGQD